LTYFSYRISYSKKIARGNKMSANVSVKYKHGKPNASNTTSWSGSVEGKSESAIMKKLKERHNGHEIIILDITWK
jgi:hypothetical protein